MKQIIICLIFLISFYNAKNALIIIDVQNCFCANGTLAVPNGGEVVPLINQLRASYYPSFFSTVVTTQD